MTGTPPCIRPRAARRVIAALVVVMVTILVGPTAGPAAAAAPMAHPSTAAPGPLALLAGSPATLMAASGFQPVRDGLQFANFEGPSSMSDGALRDLLGHRACATGPGDTGCPSATGAVWRAFATETTARGHCLGMAALAAGLFRGEAALLRRVGAPGVPTAALGRTPAVVDVIDRLTAAQLLRRVDMAVSRPMSADDVTAQLRGAWSQDHDVVLGGKGLAGDGWHAVLPTAVWARSDGRVEVSVHDSNFPAGETGFVLDPAAGTFSYRRPSATGAPVTVPGSIRDDLKLFPLEALLMPPPVDPSVADLADAVLIAVADDSDDEDVQLTPVVLDATGHRVEAVPVDLGWTECHWDVYRLPAAVPTDGPLTVCLRQDGGTATAAARLLVAGPGWSVDTGAAFPIGDDRASLTVDPTTRNAEIRRGGERG